MTVRVLRVDGWRVEHLPEVQDELALAWRAAPSGVLGSTLGDVRVKEDSSSRLRWLGHRLLGRDLRCQRALRLGALLAAVDVPCAPPLAALVHAPTRRARLVSRHLPGRDLAQALEAGEDPARVPWSELADIVARLHRAGFRQRDLKAPNVLWNEAGVALLDLDGVECVARPASRGVRIGDLGRLAASLHVAVDEETRPDLWREFLGRYLTAFEGRAPSDPALESWCEATDRRAATKVTRNRARGRPLR